MWTTTQVAAHWGLLRVSSARAALLRYGIAPVNSKVGRGGESLYDADEIRAVVRPGRGARTDLKSVK